MVDKTLNDFTATGSVADDTKFYVHKFGETDSKSALGSVLTSYFQTSLTIPSTLADLTGSTEDVQDIVGGMVTGNTETLITVTYQDVDGTLDFVVDNDLNNYSNATSGFITASSTDTLTNKTINTASNTITIVEADISDLGSYITASSTDTLTNKTFDANGTGNSISNIETADIAAGSKSGADTTLITGTAGTASDLSIWNADGDLVDGPTPPSGAIVGTTDTQTLTNKTLTSPVISDPVMERNLTTEASTSFTIGQIGYVDASGTVSAADASAEATGNKMLVMAQGTVGTGAAADFTIQGFLTTTGLTAGSVYYLSETAKGVTTTAPSTASSVVRVVGYALSTTVFYFNPDGAWVTN